MPIAVCSICGKRPHGRLATIYWATFSGDGVREAWKQRYCKADYEAACAAWLDAARASWDVDGSVQCALCDRNDVLELVETYATTFIPTQEAERFTIRACLDHSPDVARQTRQGGEALIDRQAVAGDAGRVKGW